jgi:hypothetical protein
MHRRDVLRAFSAATALALLPRESHAAWSRVASGFAPSNGLSAAHLALIGLVADTLLPRTSTPGALDVNVPAFVDVIASENYTDSDRAAFVAGLTALETHLASAAGIPFGQLAPDYRGMAIEAIERVADRSTEPVRTYWRLKGLIVHGYFTSERVMKDVLHVEVMPGRFDGNAPMRAALPTTGGH